MADDSSALLGPDEKYADRVLFRKLGQWRWRSRRSSDRRRISAAMNALRVATDTATLWAAYQRARSRESAGEVDERVNSFLERDISGQRPYVWLNATYLKSRGNRHLVNRACCGRRWDEPGRL